MDHLTTCLMFVGEVCGRAEEAMELYVSLFDDSRIVDVERDDTGTVRRATFVVAGQELVAMDSDGPHQFTFTPATSLFADLEDAAAFDRVYGGLAPGGTVLMAPGDYGFSPRFAWLNDRYGVSWQLNQAS